MMSKKLKVVLALAVIALVYKLVVQDSS